MGTGTPPPIEFVRRVASCFVHGTDLEPARELAGAELDWDAVVSAARRHRLMPLVARAVAFAFAGDAPPEIVHRLGQYQRANADRNRALAAALTRILGVLSARGIAAMAYKGPALAASVHGDLALREFVDLDVVVREPDALRARDALIADGFALSILQAVTAGGERRELSLTPARETAYLRAYKVFDLHDARRDLDLELHWRIARRYLSLPVDLEALFDRLTSVVVDGAPVPYPQPEDEMLLLLVHGWAHGWFRLHWLCDVARAMVVRDSLDWGRVLAEARPLGARRIVCHGALMAHLVFDVPLPPAVEAGADRVVREQARALRARLLGGGRFQYSTGEMAIFHLRTRERLGDKVRYAAGLAFLPGPRDWVAISLPRPIAFLYYLVRPLRLAAHNGRRALRRIIGRGRRPRPAAAPLGEGAVERR